MKNLAERGYSFTGNIIIDGADRFRCVKVFFQPSSTGKEASGFHDTSFHSIMKCNVDIRKVSRQCRVVRWHDHFFKEIVEHMTKEPKALSPSTMKFMVVASPE